jgi:tetratricopeptide (TPR) repeat protein
MKKIFLIATVLFTFFGLNAQSLQDANDLYKKGDFKQSAEIYESFLSQDLESSSLYFNLGNSYYKMNRVAPAILNYERALLLKPSDRDVKYNLRLSKTILKDKIEEIPVFFFNKWVENLVMFLNTDTWAILSISSFITVLLLMIFFFFSTSRRNKKLLFSASIVLFLFVIFANVCASSQRTRLSDRDFAIVFSPSVTLKGSPDESGTELFLLHEGTKVKIIENLGDWTNVQISDGNEGWIHKDAIRQI